MSLETELWHQEDRGSLNLNLVFFGNTKFYCSFSWENELHYLDIYKQDIDRLFAEFGCRRCEWKIHKNGACKLNKDNGMIDVCLPWN
ncbi:hypothetical protein BRARA_A03031 [Brassica rapa]|uniref:Uncharacterized protein n=1 Tax=Brassica campestris TaxID=3711 RepID=A0A398AS09_BRACM|nr:hypothetical protein BRARA_A03031 [Brassica rapa]